MFTELLYKPKAEKIPDLVPVEGEDEFAKEYNALASKLGVPIEYRVATKSKLKEFLREEGISVYSLPSVEKYLNKKETRGWAWFPLRTVDLPARYMVWVIESSLRDKDGGNSRRPEVKKYPYNSENKDSPIPLPVLLTVDRIVEKFGRDACFLVAAIDRNPDPFLAVFLRSESNELRPGEMFVVEKWNEPSYRDRG